MRRRTSLLLLLLVVAGLFGMHTVGHVKPAAAMHHEMHAPMATDPTDLCLAVLSGLIILVLAVVTLKRVHSTVNTVRVPLGVIRDAVRGPPVGLVLADLSVLRN